MNLRLHRRARLVTLVALSLALALLAGCPGLFSSSSPDRGESAFVEISSDRAFVFSRAGETARIVARVVRADGSVDGAATITFTSSAPEVVSVSAEGELRAETGSLGSATITLTAEGAASAVATAVIGELTPETVYLQENDVLGVDHAAGRVTLAVNPRTQAIAVGAILLSGDRAGLLHRVDSIAPQGVVLVAEVTLADLTDAFENVVVEVRGVATVYDAVIDEDGFRLIGGDGTPAGADEAADDEPMGPFGERELPFGRPVSWRNVSCRNKDGGLFSGSLVNVGFTGFSFEHEVSLVPRVDLVIQRRSVQRFDIYVDGVVRIKAGLAEVNVTGGVKGKIECKLDLRTIPLAFVPVLGPLGVGPSVRPAVGVELALQYTLGSLKITGPRVDRGVRMLSGLGYTNTDGFRVIRQFTELGEGVRFLEAKPQLDQEFKVSLEPFFSVTVSKSAMLGPFVLASFDFLNTKVGAGAEISMTLPLSHEERTYRGPRWSFAAALSGDLNPLLENFESLARFLRWVGIPGVERVMSLDLTLFKIGRKLLSGPEPTLTVDPREIDLEESLTLEVQARGSSGRRAEFVAFKKGEDTDPMKLGEATTNAAGNAMMSWQPKPEDDGEWDATVRVYGAFFGRFGYPYAPDNRSPFKVSAETSLTITPAGLDEGEIDTEYSFTLTANGVPSTATQVTFEWNFGDGTTGNEVAFVVNGQASILISNAYSAEGVYGIIAIVSDADGQLAQASAVVTIGEPRERDQDLNACEVWRAAASGGEGATVDNWDIGPIPSGATFDISFDAYSIPDKFIVENPNGAVVLDTGWRGDSSYAGPRYPGGIVGSGAGQVSDLFTKGSVNSFRVTVIGGESGTVWDYSIRCRAAGGGQ